MLLCAHNMYSSACYRSWWEEDRNGEQCAFGFHWEYAVCCYCWRHQHGENLYISIKLLNLCLNYTLQWWCIFTGVLCIWYCPENCYVWKEWSNSGTNSVPRYQSYSSVVSWACVNYIPVLYMISNVIWQLSFISFLVFRFGVLNAEDYSVCAPVFGFNYW